MDMFFVRPADDISAIQVAAWGESVRTLAAQYTDCTLNDMSGPDTTRLNVESLMQTGCNHLFWFGHGSDHALTAGGKDVIDKDNAGMIGGALIAIACNSANALGKEAGRAGTFQAFLGFDDEFGWPERAPLPMMFAIRNGLRCLFEDRHDLGCASKQVRRRLASARIEYKKKGEQYGLSRSEARTAWLFAKSNQYSLKSYGNRDVTIY